MSLELHLETVQAPLRFENARASWGERLLTRVRLRDGQGNEGWGEVCPLPGYSPETLSEARAWLACLRLSDAAAELEGLKDIAGPPSARFGLETALLDLKSQQSGNTYCETLSQQLSLEPQSSVRLSGMISTLDLQVARAEAMAQVQSGIVDIKVKVGRPGRFDAELEVLEVVGGCLPRQGSLRADANRAFEASMVERRLHQLAEVGVSLVEEPGPLNGLSPLKQSPVALALDETLQTPEGARQALDWAKSGFVKCLVLKPAVLGGVLASLRLAESARVAGASVSLSHLMDGPRAHRAYAAAALLSGCAGPHGLGAHAGLQAFGRQGSWPIDEGRLHLEHGQ